MKNRGIRFLDKYKIPAAVLIILFIVASIYFTGNKFYDSNAKTGILDGKTQEEIEKMLEEDVPHGMLRVSINSNPVFLNGKEEGNLRIENAPNNPYDMRVTIALSDTEEIIYKSGGIKPNQYIDNVRLDKNLEFGVYDAIVKFYATDKRHKDIGVVTREISINVLE